MKDNIAKLFFVILFVFVSCSAFAQTRVLNGTVRDADTNETIIGATVVEIGDNNRFINGTTTDINGNFSLKLSKKDAKVSISYISYLTYDIDVNASTSYLEIQLKEDIQSMETIVVVADRVATNEFMPIAERDMSTTVARISTADLGDTPSASIEEMLQGRLSGVDITGGNGDPGAGLSIRIRGSSSLDPNAQPLIVVDGIPYDTTIEDGFDFSTSDDEEIGTILDISPSDIETIEILKDAAAAAVWGSQGADGVVLITTKRGVRSETQFEFSYKTTVTFEPSEMPMLNGDQYISLQKEAIFNASGEYGAGSYQQLNYDQSWSDYYNFSQNTDWVDLVTQMGFANEANFSLRGGGEKSRYRASVGYYDQTGTTIGTSLQRLNTRVNFDYDVSDKLRFAADISYVHSDNDKTYTGSDGVAVRGAAYLKMPNMAVYEYDAYGNMSDKYFAPYTDNYQDSGTVSYNPVALAYEATNNTTSNRVNTRFSLSYDLHPTLTFKSDASLDITSKKSLTALPSIATGASWNETVYNQVTETDEESIKTQTFNKFIYQPNLGEDHRITALASFSTSDTQTITTQVQAQGLPSIEILDVAVDSRLSKMASSSVRMRSVASLINVNYVMYDKYIVTTGIRYDGDSRFGDGNRWGAFPSLSLAWRLSGESFMNNVDWLNEFKIRASYGENGRAPSSKYSQYASYTVGNSYINDSLQGISISNVQLSNLRWETTIQKNIGFDFSIFNNKVVGNFEVYSKISDDVIFDSVSIPSSSGFSTLAHMNWGAIENNGWEFQVDVKLFQNRDWTVSANFNIAQNQNIILEIPDNYATESYTFANGTYAKRIEVGQPLGSFYGYKYLGVYSTSEDAAVKDKNGNIVYDMDGNPMSMRASSSSGYEFQAGDAMYEDLNNDGIINEYDITYLGDSNPLFTGGFGLNLKYKKFTLSSFFYYKYDYDVINQTRMYAENMYNTNNQAVSTLGRWRREGDVTDIPRALYGTGYNWLGSDRFVEDASFIRLKSVNIGYTLDGKKIKAAGLKNVRLFATIYNPLTWTNYTGQDPEVSMNASNVFSVGIDSARTPANQSVMFGVNVSF